MKRLLALLLALAMVFALCACGQQAQTPAAGSADTGSKELTILTWSENECEIYAESFNKVYPDIHVNIVLADNGDVYGKLVAMATAGEQMPDLAYVEMNTRGQHLALDIWEDLSQAPYNFDGSLLEDSLQQVIRDEAGRVCIVEQNYNPAGMLYRRSLAKEYLGTDDINEVAAMIPDWDAFCEVGKTIYEKSNGTVTALPGLDEINWMIDSQYTDNIYDEETHDRLGKIMIALE